MDTTIIKSELAKITRAVDALSAMDSGESSMRQMKLDYQAYFKEVPVGSKPIPWCEGTLTRVDGAGKYLLPDGRGLTFTPTTDLSLLYSVPEIRKSFDQNYPGAFAFFSALAAIRSAVQNVTAQAQLAVPPVAPPLPPPSAAKLIWLRDKTAVVNAAKAQGKKILLFAGRENCAVTTGMRDIACETTDPPYKQLIEKSYVPWFIEVDHVPGDVQFNAWYIPPGTDSFPMPLMAVIDPSNVQVALEWPFKERCGNVDLIPMLRKYA